MKKIICLGLACVSILTLSGCESIERSLKGDRYVDQKLAENSSKEATEQLNKETKQALKADKKAFPQLDKAVAKNEAQVLIKTSKGDINIKLFPKYAPLAVENFLTHAKEGYYNGLSFHRVIKDFMIQSGDPNGDGTVGKSIWNGKDKKKDSGNGFVNEISPYLYNIRGSLAMANAGADTNGSQFFINQSQQDHSKQLSDKKVPKAIIKAYSEGGNPSLDGGYTVFGQVISGMETVDKIASVEVTKSDQPKEKITITSIKVIKDYEFK